jgi:amidophosphoribosyltransferase
VHVRISSPPVSWPCFYGIDFATRAELVATGLSVDEICASIGADSLAYLELDRLRTATGAPPESFCTACLSKEYPVPVALTGADSKLLLEAPVLDLTETGASPSP